ncbi:hypothetical protein [Amycolatopsis magusensis]|uniref:hypothetical protein n=1 Tax=Amycolatopsis magusensis TaxID=882444 RepID=UPI003C30D7D9
MITLHFLKTWLKTTAGFGLVLLAEYVLIAGFWLFLLAAGLTVVVYLVVTALIVGEWRHARQTPGAYHYAFIRDTTHD